MPRPPGGGGGGGRGPPVHGQQRKDSNHKQLLSTDFISLGDAFGIDMVRSVHSVLLLRPGAGTARWGGGGYKRLLWRCAG
jgi:hypothetical protein